MDFVLILGKVSQSVISCKFVALSICFIVCYASLVQCEETKKGANATQTTTDTNSQNATLNETSVRILRKRKQSNATVYLSVTTEREGYRRVFNGTGFIEYEKSGTTDTPPTEPRSVTYKYDVKGLLEKTASDRKPPASLSFLAGLAAFIFAIALVLKFCKCYQEYVHKGNSDKNAIIYVEDDDYDSVEFYSDTTSAVYYDTISSFCSFLRRSNYDTVTSQHSIRLAPHAQDNVTSLRAFQQSLMRTQDKGIQVNICKDKRKGARGISNRSALNEQNVLNSKPNVEHLDRIQESEIKIELEEDKSATYAKPQNSVENGSQCLGSPKRVPRFKVSFVTENEVTESNSPPDSKKSRKRQATGGSKMVVKADISPLPRLKNNSEIFPSDRELNLVGVLKQESVIAHERLQKETGYPYFRRVNIATSESGTQTCKPFQPPRPRFVSCSSSSPIRVLLSRDKLRKARSSDDIELEVKTSTSAFTPNSRVLPPKPSSCQNNPKIYGESVVPNSIDDNIKIIPGCDVLRNISCIRESPSASNISDETNSSRNGRTCDCSLHEGRTMFNKCVGCGCYFPLENDSTAVADFQTHGNNHQCELSKTNELRVPLCKCEEPNTGSMHSSECHKKRYTNNSHAPKTKVNVSIEELSNCESCALLDDTEKCEHISETARRKRIDCCRGSSVNSENSSCESSVSSGYAENSSESSLQGDNT